MGFSGLPRRKHGQQEKHGGRKSYLYYAERRKLHLESGPTLPQYASNTNISAASVRGKWRRFCSEARQDPDTLLMNLTAPDVKSWFDWIEENFSGSLKAHSALTNYWRTLKRLYFIKTYREMEPSMQRDCLNYMNVVSRRMGLRRHPLPKPTGGSGDLLHFLVTLMAHCDSVFADEKQRLYLLAGLNLSSITASRAVSFFDTRILVNLQADGCPLETSGSENPNDNVEPASSIPDTADQAPPGVSGNKTGQSSDMSELEGSDLKDILNPQSDLESTSDMSEIEETDLDDTVSLHSDLETASDVDCDSDASSVTNDGYLEGDEETRTILWRHVEFYTIRNPTPGGRNILAAIVTLLHTKGGDRKPRIKRFVIEHEENPIFDLLSQLISLAIDDDIFEATIKDVADLYTVPIPAHRTGIQMKIKKRKLDIPIFREPEYTDEGYRTSDSQPLKSRTWSRNVKRLGIQSGQEDSLTQKVFRRGGINAINNRAPSSVRDQVADHESNAVKYYLNEVVDFDTAAAFHKRPSNEIIQRELRSATLLADRTAPIGLTDAQSRKISLNPKVRSLRQICRRLTARIHAMGFKSIKDAAGTEIGDQKKRADAELNSMLTCLRDKAKARNRKRHFRNTDTAIFNQQYDDTSEPVSSERQSQLPCHYRIPERAELVRLMCYNAPAKTTEEAHHRRTEYVRLLVRWQRRKESPRRGRQAATTLQHMATSISPKAEIIPEKYDPLQCPFCLSDLRLPQVDRKKRKCKTNKLWDHVENIHQQELAAFDSGFRRCGLCRLRKIDFVPSSVSNFKNHTQSVHGIRLRE